jgi:Domain of Unknown Function (DUF928)
MKRFLYLATLSLAVFALAIFPNLTTLMPVKSEPILLSQNVKFKPPDVKDAPGNRQSAAHRGPKCPKGLSINPLIPENNIGLTVSESPTLLANVSDTLTKVDFIVILTDKEQNKKEEKIVYETELKVDKPGIIAVTIPANVDGKKSLEVGKRYKWSFSVACNPEENTVNPEENTVDRSNNFSVIGYVERIEAQPTLKNDLANSDPMARLIAYATNGIWYEAVATLADLRRKAPDDAKLTAEWTQLLQSQKLDSIADKPLVQSF